MTHPKRGGKRPGAGRKKGSGMYQEETVVKRIPRSALAVVDHFLSELKVKAANKYSLPEDMLLFKKSLKIKRVPVASLPVRAGFLTAVTEARVEEIDFNELIRGGDKNCLGIYAEGNSMIDAGISDGDLLIVNLDGYPQNREIVVAEVNQEFTVKRFLLNEKGGVLHAENKLEHYPDILLSAKDEVKFIGVVTFVLKKI